MAKKEKAQEEVKASAVDLTNLSQEELIELVQKQDLKIEELEKDLVNQKKYAAGLNKQLKEAKEQPAVTGARKPSFSFD